MEGGNFYRVGPGYQVEGGRITFLEGLKSRGRWKISSRRTAENNWYNWARGPFTKRPNSLVTKTFHSLKLIPTIVQRLRE